MKDAARLSRIGKLNIESRDERPRIQATASPRLTLWSFLGPRREARLNALLLALGLALLASSARPFDPHVAGLAAYLPLHTAMEIFTIAVAALVFAVGWNSYSRERARNVVLLSCVFLAVALLDLAHTLSFPGMPDFVTPGVPEKAINFWLAARLCAALGLLASALLPWRPFASERTRHALLAAVLGATALAYWIGLNYAHLLPRTFVPGTGLTEFKIRAEYALGLVYLAAAILFYARMRPPRQAFLHYLFAASVVSVYSELLMTVFADIADIYNLFGHVYKVIAYYLIYRAVLVFGVDEPYQRLHAAQTELLESNQRLQDLTNLSSDWFWEQDAELRFIPTTIDMASKVFVNPGAHIGRKRWELPHEDISEEEWRQHQALLQAHLPFHEFLIKRRNTAGGIEYLSISGMPIFDASGAFRGYRGVGKNVTERKRADEALRASDKRLRELNAELEQRVLVRTQQLEATNRELEAFSYSVSHDLRAPLRSIEGFSRLLLTEHADKLDASGRDYLQRIRRASLRLGELIDDLLKLARVARGDVRRERVDLSRMAEDILAELCATAPERKVNIAVEEGLVVEGDSRLLRLALENLLGNAWKFTSRNTPASIRFGTEAREGVTEIYVRDNGAGFDPKYAGKLFGAFQRLHTEQEFSGTGIGLATVQRVVHAHGGKIRAEAHPGAGATFYFTVAAPGGNGA